MPVRPHDDPTYDVDPGHGWVLFAGIVLAVVGVVNIGYGLAAVDNSQFYVRDVAFVIGDLQLWGWFLLVVGVVQIVTSVGIWRATEWGRWLGILSASINGFIQFFVMPASPLYAVMVFMIDVIVVFGLLTYGGRDRYNLAG
jgi:hypothetical protein